MRHWQVLAVAVLASMGGPACSGATSDDRGTVAASTGAAATPEELGVLPLQTVLSPSEDDQRFLDRAVDQLAGECVAERGLEYIPYPDRPPRQLLDVETRYGSLTPEQAATSGYASTAPPGDPPEYLNAVAAVDRRRLQVSPTYDDVLYGDGLSGCYPAAQKLVYGVTGGLGNLEGFAQVVEMSVQAFDTMKADADAIAANEQWSACMHDRGHPVADWQAAAQPYRGRVGAPSAEELSQASADAACRLEANLEARLLAAERRIQTVMMAESETIVGFRRALAEVVDRASAVLLAVPD